MVQLDNHVLIIVHVNFILLEVANHNFFTVPCTFSFHFLPMVLHFCFARIIYNVFFALKLLWLGHETRRGSVRVPSRVPFVNGSRAVVPFSLKSRESCRLWGAIKRLTAAGNNNDLSLRRLMRRVSSAPPPGARLPRAIVQRWNRQMTTHAISYRHCDSFTASSWAKLHATNRGLAT